MKSKQEILDGILECGIVAVVRAESADLAFRAIEAALAGGVNVIEVTFTVPGALEIISKLARTLGGDTILGAGTVLAPQTASDAIEAGARFIVSPSTSLGVIEAARRKDVPVFPGALSPTEVVTAWQAGADMVKIFPANAFGPGYLKDLHGPLPQVKFMPTGGVNLDTAMEFLKCGAEALGVGGDLINKKLMAEGKFAEITERARKFRQIVLDFRAEG